MVWRSWSTRGQRIGAHGNPGPMGDMADAIGIELGLGPNGGML